MLHVASSVLCCTHSYIVMEKMDCDLHSLIRANIIPADVARSIIFQVGRISSPQCFASRRLWLLPAGERARRCVCSLLLLPGSSVVCLFVLVIVRSYRSLCRWATLYSVWRLRVPDHLCDEVHARPEGIVSPPYPPCGICAAIRWPPAQRCDGNVLRAPHGTVGTTLGRWRRCCTATSSRRRF